MNTPGPRPTPDAASGRARRWYPYCEADGTDVVTPEIVAAIRGSGVEEVPMAELQLRVGEWKALLRRAANGSLRDESWKSVSRDPLLWELRLQLPRALVRGYFQEPAREPDSTILAKVHRKVIGASDAQTRRLQDGEIDVAGIRVRRGAGHRWGLGKSAPLA